MHLPPQFMDQEGRMASLSYGQKMQGHPAPNGQRSLMTVIMASGNWREYLISWMAVNGWISEPPLTIHLKTVVMCWQRRKRYCRTARCWKIGCTTSSTRIGWAWVRGWGSSKTTISELLADPEK